MQISELIRGIASKFEQHRIVFWYDPEQSFTEEIRALSDRALPDGEDSGSVLFAALPDDLAVLNMTTESVLAIKKRLEVDEPERPFLLYFPHAEPEADGDWLLDVRLYSTQFFADHSSMLLNELGINRMALRTHIRKRQSF